LAIIGSIWLQFGRYSIRFAYELRRWAAIGLKETSEMEDWAATTTAGFRAMGASRHREAAHAWLLAVEATTALSGDPRYAAGQTNIGVAYALLGLANEAEAAFNTAESSWTQVLDRLPELDVPVVGTSSSFHFRLASENLASFAEARRRRYARLCDACLAITRFNALFADRAAPQPKAALAAAARTLAPLLSDVLGSRSPEMSLLTEGASASAYAEKVACFDRRRRSMTGALSADCLHLETAVSLTAMIAPGLFASEASICGRASVAHEISRQDRISR
jgi:hypothetical protein